jgi:hypothetical protein
MVGCHAVSISQAPLEDRQTSGPIQGGDTAEKYYQEGRQMLTALLLFGPARACFSPAPQLFWRFAAAPDRSGNIFPIDPMGLGKF